MQPEQTPPDFSGYDTVSMIDVLHMGSAVNTFQHPLLQASVQLEAKDRSLNGIEQGGQRTTLPEASGSFKKGG